MFAEFYRKDEPVTWVDLLFRGKSERLAVAVLYDAVSCQYVNTPSHTIGGVVANQLPILFSPPYDVVSRRFLSISHPSFLLKFPIYETCDQTDADADE